MTVPWNGLQLLIDTLVLKSGSRNALYANKGAGWKELPKGKSECLGHESVRVRRASGKTSNTKILGVRNTLHRTPYKIEATFGGKPLGIRLGYTWPRQVSAAFALSPAQRTIESQYVLDSSLS